MNIVTSKSKLPSNSYGCELPPAAAMKLRRLRETRELNSAAYRATSDRFISEAHPALLQAQHNLRVLTDRNISTAYLKSGPKPAADSDLVVSAKQILEEAQAEFDRAIEVRDNCGARVHAGLHAISSVERYLQRADNFVFEAAKTPAVKLKTGESFISALDIVRAKIATARAEVERARIAPRPSSDAKKRVRATVANLAARGRPDLLDLVERGGEIAWPTVSVATQNADPFVGGVGYGEMPNSLAVFAWLHGDALITKLELD